MKNKLINLVFNLYHRFISPAYHLTFGSACHFAPTCSHYSHQAVLNHGLIKGTFLSAKRIIKCTPGRPFTYDPVPAK